MQGAGGRGKGERGLRNSKTKCPELSFTQFFPCLCPLYLSIQGHMKIVDRGTPNPMLSQLSLLEAVSKIAILLLVIFIMY